VLSVIGVVATVILFPLINPTSASAVSGFANTTNVVFTALAMPVVMFVLAFVFYSLYTFREQVAPDTPAVDLPDGPNIQATTRQQVAWLGITAALAFTTVAWGMFGFFKQTTTNPPNPLVVNVTGQQWLWTYNYPAQGVTSTVLYLPSGRPVKFRVTSKDVLHGFVIDALGVAMDANPGWWSVAPIVTPTRIGSYYSHCVELCGLYHTFMWSKVKVVSKASFAAWITANGGRVNGGTSSS
jgi:cytochrome c oxidase subunit 2